MTISIRCIQFDDALLAPMIAEAAAGDGTFLLRLRDQWISGVERFDRSGESLFVAFDDFEPVGIGGLSLDPYDPADGLARLRHLYVRNDFRRSGVGCALVAAILDAARGSFREVRLLTQEPAAARLYEGLGFAPRAGPHETHRLRL